MNLICSLVLIGFSPPVNAQEPNDPILTRVKSIAGQPLPTRPETLAKNLTQGLATDEEKLAAIQHWMVQTLAYDYEGLERGRPIYDADTCYTQKKGVCQAIAGLFIQMAQSVGVSVQQVTGEAREMTVGYKGPQFNWQPHAWVRYVGSGGIRWIDPTFSLPGQIKGQVETGLGWFLIEPSQMAHSHRALGGRLESEPLLTKQAAETVPQWDIGGMRQHGLLPLPSLGSMKLEDKIGFLLPYSGTSEFLAQIQRIDTQGNAVPPQAKESLVLKQKNSVKFIFSPSGSGWHTIQVFARPQDSSEPYRIILTVPMQVEDSVKRDSLPLLYSDFDSMGVQILAGGESGSLPADDEIELRFKMKAEGQMVLFPKKESRLAVNEIINFTKVSKEEWHWKGKLTAGEWIVGAKLPNSNRIKFLVLYTVQLKNY